MSEDVYIHNAARDTTQNASIESLFTSLFESWGTRIAALELFEREISTTRETMLTSDEADDVVTAIIATSSSDETCGIESSEGSSSVAVSSSESPRTSREPIQRSVPLIIPVIVEDSRDVEDVDSEYATRADGSEDAEKTLRAHLEKIVEESTKRRHRRVLVEEERRRTIDAARERRDAGRIISRAMKRWYDHRVHACLVVQAHFRGWVARTLSTSLRRKRQIVARMAQTWRAACVRARRIRAATRIQTSWRVYTARQLLRQAAVRRARVQQKVEEITRRYLERRERSRREHRATQIQRAWRTYIRAKRVSVSISAALCIQRIWRGARARRSVLQYRRALARRDAAAFSLDSADESDFMDSIDDDVDFLDDVFSIAENMAVTAGDLVKTSKSSTRTRDPEHSVEKGDEEIVGARYYIRRRKQFIRTQKKRQRTEDLKSNPSSRLARFQKSSAATRANKFIQLQSLGETPQRDARTRADARVRRSCGAA
jgi:hypothetical protein